MHFWPTQLKNYRNKLRFARKGCLLNFYCVTFCPKTPYAKIMLLLGIDFSQTIWTFNLYKPKI